MVERQATCIKSRTFLTLNRVCSIDLFVPESGTSLLREITAAFLHMYPCPVADDLWFLPEFRFLSYTFRMENVAFSSGNSDLPSPFFFFSFPLPVPAYHMLLLYSSKLGSHCLFSKAMDRHIVM